jgi:hypothetical protein
MDAHIMSPQPGVGLSPETFLRAAADKWGPNVDLQQHEGYTGTSADVRAPGEPGYDVTLGEGPPFMVSVDGLVEQTIEVAEWLFTVLPAGTPLYDQRGLQRTRIHASGHHR